jgi:uncharacterized lipoprotein YajG
MHKIMIVAAMFTAMLIGCSESPTVVKECPACPCSSGDCVCNQVDNCPTQVTK